MFFEQKMKDSRMKLNIDQLVQLSRSSFRTVKARLADLAPIDTDGNSIFYDGHDALMILLNETQSEELDLSAERAKLAKVQTARAELELAVRRNEYVTIDEVIEGVEREYTAIRQALLAIPKKLASDLVNISDPFTIQNEIDKEINNVLEELSADSKARTSQAERREAESKTDTDTTSPNEAY
jgi:phage terminase Nu1 subunit (DNA packaging protein)